MPKVGTITCAICQRPVDRWVIERDEADMQTIMRVFCHGAEDRMAIRDSDLLERSDAEALERAVARGGEAFRTAAIASPATQIKEPQS